MSNREMSLARQMYDFVYHAFIHLIKFFLFKITCIYFKFSFTTKQTIYFETTWKNYLSYVID